MLEKTNMTSKELIIGSLIILVFALGLSAFIYHYKQIKEDNFSYEVPKHNSNNKNNAETITRLENMILKLKQDIESGSINITLLSNQKKLVETHLNALKLE